MAKNLGKTALESSRASTLNLVRTAISPLSVDGFSNHNKKILADDRKKQRKKLNVKYWRSLLFIPQYAYSKASAIDADCFIADLQDSIPSHLKQSAREGIIDAEQKGIFKDLNLIVRINELAEKRELKKDIEKMVGLSSILGFMVTMVETAEDMNKLHDLVSAEEQRKGLPVGTYKFIVSVDTPAAIFNVLGIAKAGGGRNIAMLLGGSDLLRLTKAESNVKLTLDFLRNDVVIACRAAGIEAFDTPYTNITDKIGLEWSCISGKKHGFTGKCAIHSDHIKIIKRVFTPDPKKIIQAQKILHARKGGKLSMVEKKSPWSNFADIASQTDGLEVLDDRLIGSPDIKDALNLMEQANVLVPKAKKGIRGIVIKHETDTGLKPGDVIPNPFEITITESLLGLWQATFYTHDRTVTSQVYAQKLGLTSFNQSAVPFMMGMFLAICMNETHAAIYHLGFRNARQHAAICTGMTVRQNITVKNIRSTSDNRSVITTQRALIDVVTHKVLFTVDKLELYGPLDPSAYTAINYNVTNIAHEYAIQQLKMDVLERCAANQCLVPDKAHICPLETGQLILHSFARPMGVDSNLALSTCFKVTLPIHLDHHRYEDDDSRGIIVSGGLVEALALSASSRDFHEVIWEELIQADALTPVSPRDTIGAISYILDKKTFDTPVKYEELTVRTYGLKNISPAIECDHLDFPSELFEPNHKKPSEYDKILEEAGAYWLEGKLCTVVTRKIIRLLAD